jgi:ADP-ribose pyrophosphatase YjhB (NUDIX family)
MSGTRDSHHEPVLGLSEAEASERRSRSGPNKLPEEKKRTKLEIYIAQFKNPLIYVICVAAAISLVMGEIDNAIIIGVVILLDSVIGFFQEYKSEEALSALKSLVREKATVYRNGVRREIDTTELVPGDVVVLNEGSRIPADGKVLLVREAMDRLWTLPGGWADVNDSPSGAVGREIEQESGFRVRVVKLAALYDRNAHGHTPSLHHSWKAFFLCQIEGGAARGSYETDGVDFFDPDDLPPMSIGRCTPQQVMRMRQHFLQPGIPTDFD